jgi:cytochrome b561
MSVVRQHSSERYGHVARLLHWVIVALVIAQFVLGWTMPDVHRGMQPVGLIGWHIATGAALIAAMALRIVWRLTHRPPSSSLPPVLDTVSRATHFLLYAALIAVPVLGWVNASSRGWAVKLFGALRLPALASDGSALGLSMGDIHSALAWVLLVLIGMHVGAALFHRFVLKDKVLQRITW